MAYPDDLAEIDARIAVVRDNIRQLVEQAAALSGAADESLIADRISDQETQLAALQKQREALSK
jgi:predicted ATPase